MTAATNITGTTMRKQTLVLLVGLTAVLLPLCSTAQEQRAITPNSQSGEEMMQMRQQIMQNMIQRGIDPQQYFQEMRQKMQDGSFDLGELQKDMIDKGIMDQKMVEKMQTNFRSNALNNIKQRLAATDEEWKVIEPKLTRVMLAAADAGQPGQITGPSMMLGGTVSTSPATKAMRELRATLQDPHSASDEVAMRLRRWREAHEKAKADLAAAQKDLIDVLSARQEALLVNMGVL
jgi:hypothetical protein